MMVQKINYDKKMQEIIQGFSDLVELPTILVHSCCAPCSSSVILRLVPFFRVTVFYYNPNIDTRDEYNKRAKEQQRLINIYNEEKIAKNPVQIIEEEYLNEEFMAIAKGLETSPEGGERCFRCYFLRLNKTAVRARQMECNFFSSTLSLSPLKSAQKINEIGSRLSKPSCLWLPNDFKKRNGFLDSVNLCKKYDLYRQNYCGCIYSRRED